LGGQGHGPAALPLGKRLCHTAGLDRRYTDYVVPIHPLYDVENKILSAGVLLIYGYMFTQVQSIAVLTNYKKKKNKKMASGQSWYPLGTHLANVAHKSGISFKRRILLLPSTLAFDSLHPVF
jgi:hypothetical protein